MPRDSRKFDILDLVKRTCDYGISIQSANGAMPPGRNGPHGHTMTGARTTAHWSILFAYAYELTQDSRYRDCANAALDALISPQFRPLGGAFWHRQHDYTSSYNGLIGQAWTLEALYYGYCSLERHDLLEVGKDLVDRHPFSEARGLWVEIDLDRSARRVGTTLNQQIWFTAMALPFLGDDAPEPIRLLDSLAKNAHLRSSGLFFTGITTQSQLRRSLSVMKQWYQNRSFGDTRWGIDNGYQLFTMAGLALLYKIFPTHTYFASKAFAAALAYTFSAPYAVALKESDFGYQYNVPGFEFPFVYTVFEQHLSQAAYRIVVESVRHQLGTHLDDSRQLLTASTVDPATLVARTYEIYRVPGAFWNNIQ